MRTGDLIPIASGLAHIGVHSDPSRGAFDISSITPYGHIHYNSGIFHDPLMGQSGVIRFVTSNFEQSFNGGLSFSTLELFDAKTLQELYVGGNQITIGVNANVFLLSDTNKSSLSTAGSYAPCIFTPTSSHITTLYSGDIYSKQNRDNFTTFYYHCGGSGLVNVMIGSGLLQRPSKYYAYLPKTGDRALNVQFDASHTFSEQALPSGESVIYHLPDFNPTEIRFGEGGLYKCCFNITFDREGVLRQIGSAWATLNGTEIPQTRVYTYNRLTAHGECSAHSSFLLRVETGDVLKVRGGVYTSTDALNSDQLLLVGVPFGGLTARGGIWITLHRIRD